MSEIRNSQENISCLKGTTYSGSKRDEGIVEEAYFNDWPVEQLRGLNLRLIAATLNTKFDFIFHETFSKMCYYRCNNRGW